MFQPAGRSTAVYDTCPVRRSILPVGTTGGVSCSAPCQNLETSILRNRAYYEISRFCPFLFLAAGVSQRPPPPRRRAVSYRVL
jgi:hypothetical protein